MELSEDTHEMRYPITAYDEKSVRVAERVYQHSLIISADCLIDDWPVSNFASVNTQTLSAITALKPELVIIGTGQNFHPLTPILLNWATQTNTALETMNTPAACRTFMALLPEGRNVVAALILEDTINA